MNRNQMIKIEVPSRKRGRPPGKGRVPLSRDERRARNAEYERQRRADHADAMAELAAAVDCTGNEMSNTDILASVIIFLKQASIYGPAEDIVSLKQVNENLMKQIEDIEHRIGAEPELATDHFKKELADLMGTDSEDEEHIIRTHLNNEGRKKPKLYGTPSPHVQCSRTSKDPYAGCAVQWRARTQQEPVRLQTPPAPTAAHAQTTPCCETTAPTTSLQSLPVSNHFYTGAEYITTYGQEAQSQTGPSEFAVKSEPTDSDTIEVPSRKRGRPKGKARAPLSMEERRIRNAEYERQRRAENASAMAELAAAVGCDPAKMTVSSLIRHVITCLKKARQVSEDVDSLKRMNEKLTEQIERIKHRINSETDLVDLTVPNSNNENTPLRTHSNDEKRKKIKLNGSPEHRRKQKATRQVTLQKKRLG